ncbi:MAG: hypothetical protein KDG53_19140, partial [Rhodocyclaceae bacterium]|nr:hypothetical protein [Rhodocyclaceae bacterium]
MFVVHSALILRREAKPSLEGWAFERCTAFWIPAFAGMTIGADAVLLPVIPAKAGIQKGSAVPSEDWRITASFAPRVITGFDPVIHSAGVAS